MSYQQKHELKCCNQAELELPIIDNIVISDDEDAEEEDDGSNETDKGVNEQTDFMAYFFLKSAATDALPRRNLSVLERSLSPKKKKTTQRTRRVPNKKEKDLERLIPFSSLAGIVLTKKGIVSDRYTEESLDLIDEYCQAKPHMKIPCISRQRNQIAPETAVVKEMRKPRHYYWPKRCLNSTSREANFEFLNRSLVSEMKPCSVRLEKVTGDQIDMLQDRLKNIREEKLRAKAAECVDLCSDSEVEEDENSIIVEQDFNTTQPYRCQGEFTMYQSTTTLGMLLPGPSSSSIPKFAIAATGLSNNSESFTVYQPESNSWPISQQFCFAQSSSIVSSKRMLENEDPETHVGKRSIQNWIQTVNVENYNTAINTN